jgi:hypothetical protein
MHVRGALQQGRSPHPTVAKFFREQDYWKRLGIHLDSRPLSERPTREVEEYEMIMAELIAHENRTTRAANRGAPSAMGMPQPRGR